MTVCLFLTKADLGQILLLSIRADVRARTYMVGVWNVAWILHIVSLLCFLRFREEDKILDLEAAVEVSTTQLVAWLNPSCHLSRVQGRVSCDSGMLFPQLNSWIWSQTSGHGVMSQVIPTLGAWVPTTTRHHLTVYIPTFLLGSVAQASLFGKCCCLYFFSPL